MIKAIIFDCFGVLYIRAQEDFYRSQIPDYETHKAELQELGKQADYGLIDQQELAVQVAALSKLDLKKVQENLVSGMARNQALLDYAQDLRHHYKVGMISNISAHTMDSFFTAKERQKYFDDVVISSEVGMIKPNPTIFILACQRLGVDTSEAVMVDDLAENCAGAVAAGMQAIVYESNASLNKLINNINKL